MSRPRKELSIAKLGKSCPFEVVHVEAQEGVVHCQTAQVHSKFSAKVLKDPGECFAKSDRLSALAQPPTIVSANVEPKLEPGDEDCLGKIVTVSASVLKNSSGFIIAVVNTIHQTNRQCP